MILRGEFGSFRLGAIMCMGSMAALRPVVLRSRYPPRELGERPRMTPARRVDARFSSGLRPWMALYISARPDDGRARRAAGLLKGESCSAGLRLVVENALVKEEGWPCRILVRHDVHMEVAKTRLMALRGIVGVGSN